MLYYHDICCMCAKGMQSRPIFPILGFTCPNVGINFRISTSVHLRCFLCAVGLITIVATNASY